MSHQLQGSLQHTMSTNSGNNSRDKPVEECIGPVIDHRMGPFPCPLLVVCIVVPVGVVTVMKFASCASVEHSMRYPTGKNVLNP